MVRFAAALAGLAIAFTLNSPPAAAATSFSSVSTDTNAFYAFTRNGAHLTGPSTPVPIPGLSITLPAGSQNGMKYALVTLNMSTVSLTCNCGATGAFYLAVGKNRFASGEYTTSYTTTFSPMTIVAIIPLTFSQQVVVAEWGTGASGATLNLGPWASLSAIGLATVNP